MLKYIIILMLLLSTLATADSTTYRGATADTSKWSISGADEAPPTTTIQLYDPQARVDYFWYHRRAFVKLENLQSDLQSGSSSRVYDSCRLLVVTQTISGFEGTDSMRVLIKDITKAWNQDSTSWDTATAGVPWTVKGGDLGSSRSDTNWVDASTVVNDTFLFHIDTGFVRSMIESNNYGFALIAENKNDRGVFWVGANQNVVVTQRPIFTVYHHAGAAPSGVTVKLGNSKIGAAKL